MYISKIIYNDIYIMIYIYIHCIYIYNDIHIKICHIHIIPMIYPFMAAYVAFLWAMIGISMAYGPSHTWFHPLLFTMVSGGVEYERGKGLTYITYIIHYNTLHMNKYIYIPIKI